MKTSYFAKYKLKDGVSIAIKAPYDFLSGKCYPDLFPKAHFLFDYFQTKDEEQYTKCYYEQVLSKLNPQNVYNDLKDSTLLCWEKPNLFCHRRLVANWIETNLGIIVEEVTWLKGGN